MDDGYVVTAEATCRGPSWCGRSDGIGGKIPRPHYVISPRQRGQLKYGQLKYGKLKFEINVYAI